MADITYLRILTYGITHFVQLVFVTALQEDLVTTDVDLFVIFLLLGSYWTCHPDSSYKFFTLYVLNFITNTRRCSGRCLFHYNIIKTNFTVTVVLWVTLL